MSQKSKPLNSFKGKTKNWWETYSPICSCIKASTASSSSSGTFESPSKFDSTLNLCGSLMLVVGLFVEKIWWSSSSLSTRSSISWAKAPKTLVLAIFWAIVAAMVFYCFFGLCYSSSDLPKLELASLPKGFVIAFDSWIRTSLDSLIEVCLLMTLWSLL